MSRSPSAKESALSNIVVPCSCGSVEMQVFGVAMMSVVCYCDTCQRGSQQIEELPNTEPVRDPDGGTAYVLYRTDRIAYSRGAELLKPLKIDETATSRVYASCCNSAMVMRFDDARHWVCMYRARFRGDAPALDYRICTTFKPAGVEIPNDVPSSAMYPGGFAMKLLKAKFAMLFSPR